MAIALERAGRGSDHLRIIFRFEAGDVHDVELIDCH